MDGLTVREKVLFTHYPDEKWHALSPENQALVAGIIIPLYEGVWGVDNLSPNDSFRTETLALPMMMALGAQIIATHMERRIAQWESMSLQERAQWNFEPLTMS